MPHHKHAANMTYLMNTLGEQARRAAPVLALAAATKKNETILATADKVKQRTDEILYINRQEVIAAGERGVTSAFLDRMTLDQGRVGSIITSLKAIAAQPDPVGQVIASWERPNGLRIERVRSPLGVIGVIYESRPNVTIDAAAIALKAGSAVVLRGGSDCLKTALILHDCFVQGLKNSGLPESSVQIVRSPDRSAVGEILGGLNGAIDLVIPRGGKSLVARVQAEAKVPVLSHLDGICHAYVDGSADLEKAVAIVTNAKMRRPGVCGALETLLIDRSILDRVLGPITQSLYQKGCALRGCETIRDLDPSMGLAREEDWQTEYLDAILSIRAVDGVEGAIEHIQSYGSGHTETIIAEDQKTADAFLSRIDSAIVMHNASTQFADGGEFGLGAEIGIATGKLHARGPVGVNELLTYKNIVRGDGQVRP